MDSQPFTFFLGMCAAAALFLVAEAGYIFYEWKLEQECRDFGAFVIDDVKYQCTAQGKPADEVKP